MASFSAASATLNGRTGTSPARRAAVAGANGSGKRASSTAVTWLPARRATSAASPGSPGASPVCAGLRTATRRPRAAAATAAVTTVLPISVPVPDTTRIIDISAQPSRTAAHTARQIRATSSSPVTYGGIV